MNLKYNLILASKSPRRQQLLTDAGFKFKVKTKNVDETFPDNLKAEEIAEYIATKKAKAFLNDHENSIILTADTIVALNNEIFGKPEDAEEAFEMISKLSGSSHDVITGVSITLNKKIHTFHDKTVVSFKELSKEEINYYIENFKPFDKAGAYGIQEWIGMIGITKIEGSYFNVVGLPINKLYQQFQSLGLYLMN